MKNNFLSRFKHIPIGCTGVGVGVAGLGALYTLVLNNDANVNIVYSGIIQFILTTFAIIFLVLILLRNTTHKNTFTNEINHPLLSSFLPTICMSTMQIGGLFAFIGNLANDKTANNVLNGIGAIIWYAAIIAHLLIFSLFVWNVVRKHNLKQDNLYASWFVPPVGIIVACTVAGYFNSSITWIPNIIFQIIWYFGFSLYLITLPIVSYKLIFHRSDDKNTLPSIAIYGAPANLSLVGFLSVFTKKVNNKFLPIMDCYCLDYINTITIILTFIGLFTTLVVYLLLIRIFKIKFNPTYASLTFPLAIGATSMYKSYLYISSNYSGILFMENLIKAIHIISFVELGVATIVIGYVFVRYLILISQKLFRSPRVEN